MTYDSRPSFGPHCARCRPAASAGHVEVDSAAPGPVGAAWSDAALAFTVMLAIPSAAAGAQTVASRCDSTTLRTHPPTVQFLPTTVGGSPVRALVSQSFELELTQ